MDLKGLRSLDAPIVGRGLASQIHSAKRPTSSARGPPKSPLFRGVCLTTLIIQVPKLIMWKLPPLKAIPWLFGQKQPFDLPKEVIDLVYRQALMWTGAIYAPMICWFGLTSSALMYFIKYFCLRLLYKPPRRPFSAASIQTFFLQLLLASLFFPIVCFCIFVNATVRLLSAVGHSRGGSPRPAEKKTAAHAPVALATTPHTHPPTPPTRRPPSTSTNL